MDRSCPLHKSRDKIGFFKKTRSTGRNLMFKCTKCDVSFRTEEQFYLHALEKHYEDAPKEANVCLAEYCDILGCDYDKTAQLKHCDTKKMDKLKHKCESVFRSCFEKHSIYHVFTKEFCEPLNCFTKVHPISKHVRQPFYSLFFVELSEKLVFLKSLNLAGQVGEC